MDIASISPQLRSAGIDPADQSAAGKDPAKLKKVCQQFEAILLRQFLGDSMKPLLESGPSGQVYGYMITDSLASQISQSGGLGLSNVLQTQLSPKHK